jgi:hypothetical protein
MMITSHSKHNKNAGPIVGGALTARQMDVVVRMRIDMSPPFFFKVQGPPSLSHCVYNPQLRIGSRIQTSREKYTASGEEKKPISGSGVMCDALWVKGTLNCKMWNH